jgi:ribulose-5-phosphate 4-epimerase/fuculose-1-phosphate aldolase
MTTAHPIPDAAKRASSLGAVALRRALAALSSVSSGAHMQARQQVVLYARRMHSEHLTGATFGNVSCRVGGEPGLFAISPTRLAYDTLTPRDVCLVGLDGDQVAGSRPPTTELPLHLGLYAERWDVGAIMHTHSPAATTMAVLGWELPPILTGLVQTIGGGVRLAPYGRPGSAELADSVHEALDGRGACFLRHHGLLAVGADCAEVLLAAAATEVAARVYLDARAHSSAVSELPVAEVDWLAGEWSQHSRTRAAPD